MILSLTKPRRPSRRLCAAYHLVKLLVAEQNALGCEVFALFHRFVSLFRWQNYEKFVSPNKLYAFFCPFDVEKTRKGTETGPFLVYLLRSVVGVRWSLSMSRPIRRASFLTGREVKSGVL